mmetsp:Transcript_42235/g.137057  ORF Transcript_42235/g.137057 Transcript_42235/m.137057 type:complete len:248 (-) Transcript_42235:424-1167(-)
MPGRSSAQTTASNSRTSDVSPSSTVSSCSTASSRCATDRFTLMPLTRVGLPLASTSWTRSRTGVRRLILTSRSSRYLMIGSCRYVCGEPSSIRSTDASVRMAKSMKMVSMARAEMWSQSMKPSAYAIGSHIRSIDPRAEPLSGPSSCVNHSVKVMSSSSRTMSIPPSKSTSARTMGEVPRRSALASLSLTPSCSVRANACSPETGAPIGKRKSSAPTPPPLLMKVCVCSLRRMRSYEPVRCMMPNRL